MEFIFGSLVGLAIAIFFPKTFVTIKTKVLEVLREVMDKE